jgi:EAL domain-containing protein (putative c-di-GMP-specific phosphodiesterase class I)
MNSKSSVLLVDDDPATLRALGLVLRTSGFTVTSTDNPVEALAMIRENAFDVLVTDLRMPGHDGLDLLRTVRQSVRPLATILITGEPDLDSAVDAVAHGAFRYLIKPIEADQLREAVEHATSMTQIWRLQQQAFAHHRRRSLEGRDLKQRFNTSLDQLWVAYQPIVTGDKVVCAYEALLRPGSQTFANPGEFIHAAETLGRMRDLGSRVRKRAIEGWLANPHALGSKLFVNLHPDELTDPDLLDPDGPLMASASRLVFEISETSNVDQLPGGPEALARLRDSGMAIALDDLGNGMANLDFLIRHKPEYAKLDRALIAGIHTCVEQQMLVGKIVELCDSLGVEMVAEGVEHFEELEQLRNLGCRTFQGFLFGAPRPLPNQVAA